MQYFDTSNIVIALPVNSSDCTSIKVTTSSLFSTSPDSTNLLVNVLFGLPKIYAPVAFKSVPDSSTAVISNLCSANLTLKLNEPFQLPAVVWLALIEPCPITLSLFASISS